MNLQRLVDDIGATIRAHGAGAAVHDLALRAGNKVASIQVLKGMTVRMQDIRDPKLFEADGFEGRFVAHEDLARYAEEGVHEFSTAFLRRAFARGDRCYALFDGDTLASHGWYSNQPTSIDDRLVLRFDGNYTYMYKGFTAPAYRGKRLHAVGMCRALRAVTEEGKAGLVSWVYSNNFASLKSTARMGYRIFGTAYAIRVGPLEFTYATPGCREYGFGLERASLISKPA
ncbi:MAG: GNAT family acetyltransferase [Bacillota bacterium]